MRILVTSIHGYLKKNPPLGAPDTGGQITYILEIVKELIKDRDYEVDILTRNYNNKHIMDIEKVSDKVRILKTPFPEITEHGFPKKFIPAFIRKEDMHDYLFRFVQVASQWLGVNEKPYDLVIGHYWDGGYVGVRLAEEMKIPHIWTPHSLGLWKRESMDENLLEPDIKSLRLDERIREEVDIINRSQQIIATSYEQKDFLVDKYITSKFKISVIPPGVDITRFYRVTEQEQMVSKLKVAFRNNYILCVGRLAENKGFDLLFKSMQEVIRMVPDVKLILPFLPKDKSMLLDSPNTLFIRKLMILAKKVRIEDYIEWRPVIPNEDMADYYRSASVFVMPSRYEPFGIVAIEAMACGTPSVITRNGGLADELLFATNALLVNPENICELATMIALPMMYPDIANRLSRNGSQKIMQDMKWEDRATALHELIIHTLS